MSRKIRTIIGLEPEDKAWLDSCAQEEGVSMTELVRRAVRKLRQESESKPQPSWDEILQQTKGTWKKGDGLAYQHQIRSEWASD